MYIQTFVQIQPEFSCRTVLWASKFLQAPPKSPFPSLLIIRAITDQASVPEGCGNHSFAAFWVGLLWDRISLSRPGEPGTLNPPVLISQVLGLQVCIISASLVFVCILLWSKVSWSPDWPQTHCVIKGDSSQIWDYRRAPTCWGSLLFITGWYLISRL